MNFTPFQTSGIAILLMVLPFCAQADDATQNNNTISGKLADMASFALDQRSITVGLAYSQVTYKATQAGSKAQLTDNGAPSPILELNTSGNLLHSWPLRTGSAVLEWDINASASVFDTGYQLTNSALRGQSIGTGVRGGYVGVAPMLHLKVGPLLPDSELYWKIGYGLGPGLLKSSGTAMFNTPQGNTINVVGSNAPVLALYNTAAWQLQAGHWYFDILGKWLLPQDSQHTSLESYGAGVAYRFDW